MSWPLAVAILAFMAGMGLFIAGIFVLVGLGWAFLAGAVSCVLLSALIIRGGGGR
jgi:hypothetical protein